MQIVNNKIKRSVIYTRSARIYHGIKRLIYGIGHLDSEKVDSIYVINLERRPERLSKMLENLKKCKIPIRRFDAVDGSQFEDDYLREFAPTSHRPLSKGQVACFLSHRACWLKCLEQDGSVFWIMEDDARIKYIYARHLDKWLQEIEDSDPDWDIIYTFKKPVDSFYDLMCLKGVLPFVATADRCYDQAVSRHAVRSGPTTHCVAYLLSRRGILKLLKMTENIVYPVDVQIPLNHKELKMYAFSSLISYVDRDGISDSAL